MRPRTSLLPRGVLSPPYPWEKHRPSVPGRCAVPTLSLGDVHSPSYPKGTGAAVLAGSNSSLPLPRHPSSNLPSASLTFFPPTTAGGPAVGFPSVWTTGCWKCATNQLSVAVGDVVVFLVLGHYIPSPPLPPPACSVVLNTSNVRE